MEAWLSSRELHESRENNERQVSGAREAWPICDSI